MAGRPRVLRGAVLPRGLRHRRRAVAGRRGDVQQPEHAGGDGGSAPVAGPTRRRGGQPRHRDRPDQAQGNLGASQRDDDGDVHARVDGQRVRG